MKSQPIRQANQLAVLKAACRKHGLPLTIQRTVILEALADREDHPAADQIYEAVRERLPSISRTTVYRVLETLVRIGLAVKTCTPGSSVRFDPRTERHHHLVCAQCDRVIDVLEPTLDRLVLPRARRAGFEIRDYSVHFRGLCGTCRQEKAGPSPTGTRRKQRGPRQLSGEGTS